MDFGNHTENRENWLNIDTIRIPCQIIYLVNSIYYKNPTEFFRNRKKGLKQGNNRFFDPKKAEIRRHAWQARNVNNRKKRKGAFWEDRYHATAIETGEHLLRCLVYLDLNMVRAGVVSHPEQWRHGGYNEIQHRRRKNILVDYEALSRLSGFDDFESFQSAHQRWVQSALSDDKVKREGCWTQSIATGSRSFVEAAKGRCAALRSAVMFGRRQKASNFGSPSRPLRIFLVLKRSI